MCKLLSKAATYDLLVWESQSLGLHLYALRATLNHSHANTQNAFASAMVTCRHPHILIATLNGRAPCGCPSLPSGACPHSCLMAGILRYAFSNLSRPMCATVHARIAPRGGDNPFPGWCCSPDSLVSFPTFFLKISHLGIVSPRRGQFPNKMGMHFKCSLCMGPIW